MKKIKITKKKLFGGITIWWSTFVVFSLLHFNSFGLLSIIGFPALIIFPGLLTLLSLRLKNNEFWGNLGLVIGFSLLELMMLVLLGNTLLPYAHISRPLDTIPILAQTSGLVFVLLLIAWKRSKNFRFKVPKFVISDESKDALIGLFPFVFVLASIFGAVTLNNGGNGNIILAMLIGIALYFVMLLRKASTLGKSTVPTALFFLSLSLLFMTSLRGWYITGHDIQREYRVFEVAKNSGIWSIKTYTDAYNACMSITVLPTVFSNTLALTDPYIYKILFQIIFAIVPVITFLTIRKFIPEVLALVSTLYFIAFPTFFSDMPFLNRQEIAFVFLVLMFYLIFNERLSRTIKKIVFTLLGVGMIFSHYTTTYTVLALLIFLVMTRPIAMWFGKRISKFKWLSQSSINLRSHKVKPNITIFMVGILIAVTFVWTTILTDTAHGSLYRVISETISTMGSNVKEDLRSGDVHYSIFSLHSLDVNALFMQYQEKVVEIARSDSPSQIYYDSATYDKFPIQLVNDSTMPLTSLGNSIRSLGIDVASFNTIFRQSSAKVLQALLMLGLIVSLFKKRFLVKKLSIEYILLTVGSLLFVFAQIILPLLSTEYGVLRAFQQSMIFFGMFIVLGSAACMITSNNKIKVLFSSFLALIFFLSSTGVFTQILGGYGAQLHLNNSGLYYNSYYVESDEIAGVHWLLTQAKPSQTLSIQTNMQTDIFQSHTTNIKSDIETYGDIYPGLIRRDSYVFLDHYNLNYSQGSISYNDTLFHYSYPIPFLDEQKDLIYNSGETRIYK